MRPAARALALAPPGPVPQFRFVGPATGASIWATPGAGIAPDETPEEAVAKELREELGRDDLRGDEPIWPRRQALARALVDVREALVRTDLVDPGPAIGTTSLRAENAHENRWWSVDEIGRADAESAPARLSRLLRDLPEGGPRPKPVDLGVRRHLAALPRPPDLLGRPAAGPLRPRKSRKP